MIVSRIRWEDDQFVLVDGVPWQHKGLCAGSHDPDAWMIETDRKFMNEPVEETGAVYRTAQAVRMCMRCPVREICAEEGFKEENLPYGTWGGLMAGERLKIARRSGSGELVYYLRFARRVREFIQELEEKE